METSPPPPHNASVQPPPTCPRCQRTFRTLTGHLLTNCSARTAITVVSPATSPSPFTPSTSVDRPLEPFPSSPSFSTASTSAAVVSAMPINTIYNPDTATNTNTTTTTTVNTSDGDRVYTCPYSDHTFISHIGLVGHLSIHRIATGEPVPEAQTYTLRIRLHCSHCPRTFMHRMGLFGHMRIHESGIDRSPDTPSTSSAPIMPGPVRTPRPSAHRRLLVSILSPHIDLTHPPGRSPANPSHSEWWTSAWIPNLHSPHPPLLSTLHSHIYSPPGSVSHMRVHENLR
ncbi:hypothetical protein SprV_0401545100 [Sparganum proliferum]